MARSLRIEYPSAWYHVMNRGADRKNIFHATNYFQLFFDILERTHEKFGIELHAYCLMNNHYHLLIKTPLPNLGKAMQHINGLYTQKYNKLQNKDGPLFRGRYKAILIEAESYLLQVNRYIHLNPIAAQLVGAPEEYPWSSYKYYLSSQHKPNWLFCNEILSRFKNHDPIKDYVKFINNGVDEETLKFYSNLKLFPILGSKVFINKVNSENISSPSLPLLPDHLAISKALLPSVEIIIDVIASHFKINPLKIKKNINRTSKNTPRNIAMYLALKFSGQDRKSISHLFEEVSYLSLSAIARKIELSLKTNAKLLKDIESIKDKLITCLDLTP